MGHIGMIASKLDENLKIMKNFDESIRNFRQIKQVEVKEDIIPLISNILIIISPLTKVIKGDLSRSPLIDEDSILNTLKKGFSENWSGYKIKILKLEEKMKSKNFNLTESDFSILNDIGDAIDVECINLFNRMKEG